MESNNDRNATWALELNVRYHFLSVHYDLTWCFSNKYKCRVMFLKMMWQSIEAAALSLSLSFSVEFLGHVSFIIIGALLFHLSSYCYMAKPT
jgi:hypothetical protein